jgi:hypothetical protein
LPLGPEEPDADEERGTEDVDWGGPHVVVEEDDGGWDE